MKKNTIIFSVIVLLLVFLGFCAYYFYNFPWAGGVSGTIDLSVPITNIATTTKTTIATSSAPSDAVIVNPECVWKKLSSINPTFSVIVENCSYAEGGSYSSKIKNDSVVMSSNAIGEGDVGPYVATSTLIKFFNKLPAESPAIVLNRLFISKLTDPYERLHCTAQNDSKWLNPANLFYKDHNKSAWYIAPDAEYEAKIAKNTPPDNQYESACGGYPYGFSSDVVTYFEFHVNSLDKFAWVDMGQDGPVFDKQSLEF